MIDRYDAPDGMVAVRGQMYAKVVFMILKE